MAAPVLSANTPVAGSISWTEFHLAYRGVSYDIPAGSTSSKYTWWPYNGGAGGALRFSDTLPVLTTDDALLFLNKNGVPVSVPSTQAIDGSLIVSGSILADAIGANQVTAAQIFAGSVTTEKMAANAVTADKIAAGAITAASLAADAITGKTITGGVITGTSITGTTITGAAITGGTVTGAAVQTSTTGQRIKLDSTGDEILFYSGDVSERGPGILYSDVLGTGSTRRGRLTLTPPSLANPANVYSVFYNPGLVMTSPNQGNTADSEMYLQADTIYVAASVGTSAGGRIVMYTDNHMIEMKDSVGTTVTTTFNNGSGLTNNRANIASGTYSSVTFTYGPTMQTVPVVVADMDLNGLASEHSQGFVTATSFRMYSYTDAGGNRWAAGGSAPTVYVPYIALAGA